MGQVGLPPRNLEAGLNRWVPFNCRRPEGHVPLSSSAQPGVDMVNQIACIYVRKLSLYIYMNICICSYICGICMCYIYMFIYIESELANIYI